jgi:polyphosphate:AMP phosphotransferase
VFEVAEIGSTLSKEEYEQAVPQLRVDLLNAQFDLRDADFSVLVLLGGDDRLGVNDTLGRFHEWMDARYLVTRAFDLVQEHEARWPFFWRYWRELPPAGRIGVFRGDWTLHAIAEHVLEKGKEETLDARLRHARELERALVDDGTVVLKFFLHLPEKQFKKRFKKDKDWRVGPRDWRMYENYDEAIPVAEKALRETSDPVPWQIVESTDARYRDLTVARAILTAVKQRLSSPPPTPTARAAASVVPDVLARVDLSSSLPREEYRERLDPLQARLLRNVRALKDQGTSAVLVFEGWDAAGKGGCIRRLTRPLDPADYRLLPISAPSDEERARHYLWRFWRRVPAPGQLAIFDRSWYGRVLVERVEGFASEAEWRRAYGEINDFEEQLVEHGMVVVKFWLHIDADEQLRRFEERAETAYKKYKLTDEDYRNREKWPRYVEAANEMFARTSTGLAPWHRIPANDKRFARIEVLRRTCEALKQAL